MRKPYQELKVAEREALLKKLYIDEGKSFYEVAEILDTYPNRLRRDAIRFNLPLRGKSEAQTKALKSGRAQHATEGKNHTPEARVKISEKRAAAWKDMSQDERDKVSEMAKEQWDSMTPIQLKRMRELAAEGIRESAKRGSKLERYLLQQLMANGFHAEFHKEHLLVNERLHLDLFLPTIGVAIEVDGPSHHLPIWGDKTLLRNKKSDSQKNGLLLSKGLILIRIKQLEALTEKYKRDVAAQLVALVKSISTNKPKEGSRYFEI